MTKILFSTMVAGALLLGAAPALAQRIDPGAVCPSGSRYATIRHSIVKPGQWATFEAAVAAHNAWYAAHDNRTATRLARVIAPRAAGLSTAEAVTITTYSSAPQPAHDAGYEAFTAKYRASSTLKDEARICMP